MDGGGADGVAAAEGADGVAVDSHEGRPSISISLEGPGGELCRSGWGKGWLAGDALVNQSGIPARSSRPEAGLMGAAVGVAGDTDASRAALAGGGGGSVVDAAATSGGAGAALNHEGSPSADAAGARVGAVSAAGEVEVNHEGRPSSAWAWLAGVGSGGEPRLLFSPRANSLR